MYGILILIATNNVGGNIFIVLLNNSYTTKMSYLIKSFCSISFHRKELKKKLLKKGSFKHAAYKDEFC